MLNEKFFLALSFALFAVLIIKYVWPIIAKALDSRSKQIAQDILAAKELRKQAEELLESIEKYKEESEKYVTKLLHDAEIESQKLIVDAKTSASAEISRKTEAALERIKIEESSAIREIKAHIVDSAMENLNAELEKNVSDNQEKFFNIAIKNI
jgi:F-type H+-transporting ATPase subunit b